VNQAREGSRDPGAPPIRPRPGPASEAGFPSTPFEGSSFEPSGYGGEAAAAGSVPNPRWIGWRRRLLVVLVLLGCIGVLVLARLLSLTPALEGHWSSDEQGRLALSTSPLPALAPRQGEVLLAIDAPDADGNLQRLPVDAALLHRSPRWQASDAARARQLQQHTALASQLGQGSVVLHFASGEPVRVAAAPRGFAGLGWLFWPLAGLALVLVVVGAVVVLARPGGAQALFAVMAACQAGNLLLIAAQTLPGLGLPAQALAIDLPLRLALDLLTGAAAVQALGLHPARPLRSPAVAAAAWALALVAPLLAAGDLLRPAWWWAQALCLLLGTAAWVLLARTPVPDARVRVMRRFCALAVGTLLLVTAAVAAASLLPGAAPVAHGVAVGASVAWYLFLASLLLLTPFLARSRHLLREFALLAGISTVAASVDLLFVAVFSLSTFTSLAVAVFVALAIYAGARQVLLQRLLGTTLLTTERTFEHLYRAARELQAHPERHVPLLGQLLRELFEPLELVRAAKPPPRSRVLGGGSALLVPVRAGNSAPTQALLLRHAQRGRRLFMPDDARLADRLVDQLRRALAYDRAVERGRAEERQRIAQDLHDDIGARLLTLMYQAQTPEMEDYIRHTLQDLKTLTRGLAAAEHRLGDAAAEWKADLGQRLAAASAELAWSLSGDPAQRLTVVQWSGLTRVLRELVSNALYHGHATRVEVLLQLTGERLLLRVADDGEGQAPEAWSHGLGLGGVRKRVKLMGGQVEWRAQQPRGIVCEVVVEHFAAGASTAGEASR
jgi:signal transduction histidine kinase